MNTLRTSGAIAIRYDDGSPIALIGKMLGLKSVRTEIDLLERLESGFRVAAVRNLQRHADLTATEIYALIAPRRTLRREACGRPLSSKEGDRTVRVAQVFANARQVFAGRP